MRWFIPLVLAPLAACSLPGQQTLAPDPVPADARSIAATQAFAGRVPLVIIQPGTVDFAGPLKAAVVQALAIKPSAAFEVRAQAPAGFAPDKAAAVLTSLAPLADSVAHSISVDGVPAAQIALTAQTGGAGPGVFVYVK